LVIFLLRTIVLPLLTLWGFVRIMRWLLGRADAGQQLEQGFKERMGAPVTRPTSTDA